MNLKTLQVEISDGVARVMLNRPDKANAMVEAMWHELREAMRWADETKEVRVVVIGGNGKHFTAGIDLSMLMNLNANLHDDCIGRAREKLRRFILDLQDTLTSIERCRKPVIAEVHGACIGGGIDLITACDMRYCSTDAYFCVKEIDVGMAADRHSHHLLAVDHHGRSVQPPCAGPPPMMATCVRNLCFSMCLRIGFCPPPKLIIPDNNTEKGCRPLAESRSRQAAR